MFFGGVRVALPLGSCHQASPTATGRAGGSNQPRSGANKPPQVHTRGWVDSSQLLRGCMPSVKCLIVSGSRCGWCVCVGGEFLEPPPSPGRVQPAPFFQPADWTPPPRRSLRNAQCGGGHNRPPTPWRRIWATRSGPPTGPAWSSPGPGVFYVKGPLLPLAG